ncbi:MAG TPA: hypothetical protein PK177_21990, partial [Burkholderiaceae bacterium]|nr:hypothetical protein [Burkholderiaceae bacterium]
MADEQTGLPPLEIPWKLAATTQPLVVGEPDETTISLFFFEPAEEDLPDEVEPDERLVYLKFTVSVSPAAFPPGTPPGSGGALGAGVPCFHLQLDLKVRKASGELGTIRPYFHAAAPLYRRTLQTGVVGVDVFEGESEGQSMGKSRSQMYESSKTHSSTTSASLSVGAGVPIGPVSLGASGSVRTTTTDIAGRREGAQAIDQTTREASEERRELVSHHTRVENILTLLSAKYVGTPHLRFSLSPSPMTLLSVDPSDPNLWFSQLLARRSSGLEGIQEFTTVVIVPRGEDFCVNARLRRVCVLDVPPGPLEFTEPFNLQLHLGRVLNYLDRVYPPGTPLEEFDVDLIGALPLPDDFTRPVLRNFSVAGFVMIADVTSPTPLPFPGSVKNASVNYKMHLELWLETLRDEYEREVARSPLERGVLMGEERFLDTCFAFAAANGGLAVSGSNAQIGPLLRIEVDRHDFDLGGITSAASSAGKTTRERAYEAVTRWNLLENRLVALLSNRLRQPRDKRFTFDAAVVDILIESWARLPAGDPGNLGFDDAIAALHFDDRQRKLLDSVGARDLRGIAEAIRSTPTIERYNRDSDERRRIHKEEKRAGPAPDTL